MSGTSASFWFINKMFIYLFIYLFHKFDIWYLLTRQKLKRYLNKWNTRNKVTLQGAKQPWYIILISEWKVVHLFKKYLFSPHFLEIRSIFYRWKMYLQGSKLSIILQKELSLCHKLTYSITFFFWNLMV